MGFDPFGWAENGLGLDTHVHADPTYMNSIDPAGPSRFQNYFNQYFNPNVTLPMGGTNGFRQGQQNLVGGLQQQASGQGPSLAQALYARAQQQQMAQQNALANSARGGMNPALLQRQAMMNNAQANQQNASGLVAARQQEQMSAQQQLGQALSSARQQDIGENQNQQNFGLGLENVMMNRNIADQNAQANAAKINAGIAENNTQNNTKFVGGILSGAGSLMAMSDKREKKDIGDGKKDLRDFLDALSSAKYKYKNPKDANASEGEKFSPMAQELEKTKVGKSMVTERPDGKKIVNYGSGFGAILASQAALHQRLKELEARKAK